MVVAQRAVGAMAGWAGVWELAVPLLHAPVQRQQIARPAQGGAVLFLGKVYHAARPITRGERFVLVGLIERRAADDVTAEVVGEGRHT